MQYPFVIFALPRSRTAWLSAWLSYNGLQVGHDLAPTVDTCQGFLDALWPRIGTVETGAQDAHRLLRRAMPGTKFVVIRRPVDQVVASLAQFGVTDQREELERRAAVLDEIDGAMSIDYDSLRDARVCADLWEHLLGIPFDFNWWRHMDRQNIQVDVPAQLQFIAGRQAEIAALKNEVHTYDTHHTDDTCGPCFLRVGWEPFDSTWADAEPLGQAHSIEVNAGVRPGHPFDLDVELLRQMEASGLFRVITARLDGTLVGYLTWSFVPDPESRGVMIADQGAWFVDPAHPGIGKKLLDRAIPLLRQIGIHSVQLHHQLNGRGAKLGSLFRRMGAIEHQHRYTLWIGDEGGGHPEREKCPA